MQTKTDNIFDQPMPQPFPMERAAGDNLPMAEGAFPVMHRPLAPSKTTTPELEFMARMAQGIERDENQALKRAARQGELLGQRAMYSFPAGGGRVEGPTVQLAEALASEWGYLMWSAEVVKEDGDRVTIRASVVDALRCTATVRPGVFTLPPAPKGFAKRPEQADRWRTMQIQSAISKAIRTALIHALPDWYVEAAKASSRNQMSKDYLNGKTLGDARKDCASAFEKEFHASIGQLEDHLGAAMGLWTITDIVTLRELYSDLKHGRMSFEAVFGEADEKPAKKQKPSGVDAVKAAAEKAKAKAEAMPEGELL